MRGILSRLLSAHDWSSSWVLAQPRAVMSSGSESPPLSIEPRAYRAMSALSLMALRSTCVIWPIFSSKVIALSNSSVFAAAAASSSSAFAAAAVPLAIPGRKAVAERIHQLSVRWSIIIVASRMCGGSRSGSATGGDDAAGPFFPGWRESGTSSTCQCHARSVWIRASTRPLRPGLFPGRRGLGRCRRVFLHFPGAHLGFRRGPAIFLTLARGRRRDLLGAAIQAVEGLLDVDVGDLADGLGAGLFLVNPSWRVQREVGDVDPE